MFYIEALEVSWFIVLHWIEKFERDDHCIVESIVAAFHMPIAKCDGILFCFEELRTNIFKLIAHIFKLIAHCAAHENKPARYFLVGGGHMIKNQTITKFELPNLVAGNS